MASLTSEDRKKIDQLASMGLSGLDMYSDYLATMVRDEKLDISAAAKQIIWTTVVDGVQSGEINNKSKMHDAMQQAMDALRASIGEEGIPVNKEGWKELSRAKSLIDAHIGKVVNHYFGANSDKAQPFKQFKTLVLSKKVTIKPLSTTQETTEQTTKIEESMSPQQIQAAIEQAKESDNREEMKRLQAQLQQMLDADSVEEMAIDRMKVGNKSIEWSDEGEDLHMIKDTEGTKIHAIGNRKEIAAKWAKIKQSRGVTENAQQFEIEYEISEPSGEKSSGKTKYKGVDQNAAKQRFMDDNKGKNVTVKSVKLVTEEQIQEKSMGRKLFTDLDQWIDYVEDAGASVRSHGYDKNVHLAVTDAGFVGEFDADSNEGWAYEAIWKDKAMESYAYAINKSLGM